MAKITNSDRNKRDTVVVKTKPDKQKVNEAFNWWKANSKKELAAQVISTAAFLKEQQQYRFRQASIHARLYGNIPLSNFAGANANKLSGQQNLPMDRPTMNVVQSCIDTLTSKIAQAKPRPLFLTDNGRYKQRTLAKQMNTFISGELYQTKAHDLCEQILRDGSILGTGCLKVLEKDDKVHLERTLCTELYVDNNDAFYGSPRSMYQLKLVDRSVLKEIMPEERSKIEQAEQAYPDQSGDSQQTMSDQVMLVEAWHLPSSKDATDGRHVIACTSGVILDEEYKDETFPFVFFNYSPRMVGFWAQGLAEQLMGTQVEINKLLSTISQSISLVGVPRVFVEDGSKVVKAHLNDSIGSIVTYRGTKPQYEVAPCVPQELYAQLQRLIEYSYQQSGISALSATSQKPAGLNSGEAIRSYDDLQTDRFATIEKRYKQLFVDLSYKIINKAKEICERTGKYETVYPNKDGTQQIDLPKADLLENPFVIQCLDSSSLPKDPAGRLQTITEMMQAGIIPPDEGRRLLDFPDLSQANKLASAPIERIYKQLDDIIDKGESGYEPPDSFTDLANAAKIVSQYYNMFAVTNLEESKLELLRQWQSQVVSMQQAALPPQPEMGMPGMPGSPQGVPQANPQSDLMSQVSQ
jgi:hypothetical protein